MARPLFRKTTDELERLFLENLDSPAQLRAIAFELTHRQRPRAVALHKRVADTLAQQDQRGQTSPRSPSPTRSETTPNAHSYGPNETLFPEEQETPISNSESAPPAAFTLVQPMGVRPRPSAFRPTLKTDLRLPTSHGDPPAKRFRVALDALIGEMKRRGISYQRFILQDGQRIAVGSDEYSYQFEFVEEAGVFEGAHVELIIGGKVVDGHLTAVLHGRLIITLQNDFGDVIASCTLRIDTTAFLQALRERLAKIENGDVPTFRADAAGQILQNRGVQKASTPHVQWPWHTAPTENQRRFVAMAITNDVSWLFGPPGTGKTDTLSALTQLLYASGKRVLVCSNTNQAVDQLLYKLCNHMRRVQDPGLDEGRVVRLGKIDDALDNAHGAFITLEGIAERRSRELVERQAEIQGLLERTGRAVQYSHDVLRRFASLDDAIKSRNESEAALRLAANAEVEAQAAVASVESTCSTLADEWQRWRQAGTLRRLLMRSESVIRQELTAQQPRLLAATRALDTQRQQHLRAKEEHQNALGMVAQAERAVVGEDRGLHSKAVEEYAAFCRPLRDELASIARTLESLRATILRDARIVGATITKTFLSPLEFSNFDTVIVDEASMILLPAVFQVVGIATDSVVIAGDFQQLPPIIQTEQQAIHDVLAHDVFSEAGIDIDRAASGIVPRLVMLDEQFRMDNSICSLVSSTFYNQRLRTSPCRPSRVYAESNVLSERFTIIDTASIWPFTTRNPFNSRLNLMHALVVRNLILHLKDGNRLRDESGSSRVGVCTPYAAQAKLIREIVRSHGIDNALLRTSTVHGFQGDERELMILDLVDSVGERRAGLFLQANQPGDSGAKLTNVALSRAREGLIVVANLTFLDQKLPSDAILRGLLHDIQLSAKIIDVREILALHPIADDLKRYVNPPVLDPECLRTGLFAGADFAKLSRVDIEHAQRSIVVFSGFISEERAAQLGDLFRHKLAEGVRVRCVTRPPKRNGTIPEEQGRRALQGLESLGVSVDLRNDIHEKVVLIDNAIAWFGSLNPLSHTSRTSELMARVDNAGVASQIASILSISRRFPDDLENGGFAAPENPRCETCRGWSVYIRGKYGPFFACAGSCGWKQSVDSVRRKRG